jgi:hypothetical protein
MCLPLGARTHAAREKHARSTRAPSVHRGTQPQLLYTHRCECSHPPDSKHAAFDGQRTGSLSSLLAKSARSTGGGGTSSKAWCWLGLSRQNREGFLTNMVSFRVGRGLPRRTQLISTVPHRVKTPFLRDVTTKTDTLSFFERTPVFSQKHGTF